MKVTTPHPLNLGLGELPFPPNWREVRTGACRRTAIATMKWLSLSKKPRSKKVPQDFRDPGVYVDDLACPSGIANTGNSCYASAILQCLFNLPGFTDIAREIYRVHPGNCNNICCNRST